MPLTICDNMVPFMFPYLKGFRRRRDSNKRGHGHYRNSIIDVSMYIFEIPSSFKTSICSKASITSIVMDDLNVEGMLGTAEGNIHYINF